MRPDIDPPCIPVVVRDRAAGTDLACRGWSVTAGAPGGTPVRPPASTDARSRRGPSALRPPRPLVRRHVLVTGASTGLGFWDVSVELTGVDPSVHLG